ncbi:alpha-2-macroglobulin family protein [Bacteroides ihuae]|uniref:alpha-2-macroglobulin family protein n=1 Tax=Bacteroides ihuae TaxID=1852362 RepID=UPI0008D92547|nr:alpha-2-macroglobulin family protein [Bacteroides ihuae]
MKLKFIIVIFITTLSTFVCAQSYDKRWKQVEEAQKRALPQTMIKLAEGIFSKAEAERNSPQMLKAYMCGMNYQQIHTPDSFYVRLKDMEQWIKATTVPLDRAILNSLVAEIYADYAASNLWQLRQRTDIVDDDQMTDIRAWSGNLFVHKIQEHVQAALQDSLLLLNASSTSYVPFTEEGEASAYYQHDMYHLLSSRSISALSSISALGNDTIIKRNIANIYENLINAYRNKGNQNAIVLASLDSLKWQQQTINSFSIIPAKFELADFNSHPFVVALDKLIAANRGRDICVEAYLEKAEFARNKELNALALQLCDEAIYLYPKYKRVNALRSLKQDILNPYLDVQTDKIVYPQSELKLSVNHKNIDGFTITYSLVNLPANSTALSGKINKVFYKKYCKKIASKHFALIRPNNYLLKDTALNFTAPIEGVYLLQIIPDAKAEGYADQSFFYSTKFKVLSRKLPDDQQEFIALDALTGHPVSGAMIRLFDNKKGERIEKKSLTADAQGRVELPISAEYDYFTVEKGNDKAMPMQNIHRGAYSFSADQQAKQQVKLLTDRSLYRPGQTIYVKGIAYSLLSDTAAVISNQDYELTLTGSNGQEIGRRKVRTNNFGSFTTELVLPSACLNGIYELRTQDGQLSIRVEEYKRPTFNVTFSPQEGTSQLGDSVQVKGLAQSYSGIPLQDVVAKYTVTRSSWKSWRTAYEQSTLLASGEVNLEEDGTFLIPFLLKEEAGEKEGQRYYTYNVEASVTSKTGETQSSTTSLVAADHSLLLATNLSERVCKDDTIRVTFEAKNLNSQPIKIDGEYKLYASAEDNKTSVSEVAIYSDSFVSNKEILLSAWQTLPSGAYKLVLTAKDDKGRTVTSEQKVVLFSMSDTRPAEQSTVWYYAVNTSFDASHPATFVFGTSEKDAYVMMDVFSGNKRLESTILNLSDSVKRFDIPYKTEYGDGLKILFGFVKNGELYQQGVDVMKRMPEKTLVAKWAVFRDKLRPGEKEEWKLTLRTPQGVPAVAEMLATMYDASLDKIWKNNQSLNIAYSRRLPFVNWNDYYWGANYYGWNFLNNGFTIPSLDYDSFVNTGQNNFMQYAASTKSSNMRARGVPAGKVEVKYVALDVQGKASANLSIQAVDSHESLSPEVNLRTNFAETAFFYPQLFTNDKGEVVFSFTMPESLTTWNFRGYAHTKGMLTAEMEDEVVTSKEFMLTPNLPRFVRVGDKTSVAASVANLTGKSISGVVKFVLFDPITEKVIATQKQKFSTDAGKTESVQFLFTATDKYDVLGCRLIAEGDTFSDGEQHVLPVLSNKQNVTESLAMPIRGGETRDFSLEKLFNQGSKTATGKRLTVEFTSNPAWYAVQALPSLSLPTNDNAISWAATYYANALAAFIVNTQPKVKAKFDAWKMQGGTKETFLSNLQKNQEVKNILLEESPWLAEATNEAEQKERIATLFDLNNIQNKNVTALTKLKELQLSNGSWTWYKGMNGSRYITSYVVETLARLTRLIGTPLDGDALVMQKAALNYLHAEALKEYKAIIKAEKSGHKSIGISGEALDYLYLLSLSNEKVRESNKSAYDYFLAKISQSLSSSSLTEKAHSAIVLHSAGRTKEAEAFIASLKEYAVQTDEQGMHFAFNESPYAWNSLRIPVHVAVMEAFDMVDGDTTSVEEMKLWLLKQKQTQQWSSPVATVDAVYALLYRAKSLLDNQGKVRITLGAKKIEPQQATQGLGYVKEVITDAQTIEKLSSIKVEKLDEGIAWGAVYAQYREEMNKLQQQGKELNVEKRLYVERIANNTKQLYPLSSESKLAIGDKVVVRLTIRLDRSMDFVQLKDQRASCFEPINSISGYQWNSGTGYYVDIKEASTNFFFDSLKKGIYVLEYGYTVSRAGVYESGLATIQSAYAPEYASHSASSKVEVLN